MSNFCLRLDSPKVAKVADFMQEEIVLGQTKKFFFFFFF
jgi:hypothetical protein